MVSGKSPALKEYTDKVPRDTRAGDVEPALRCSIYRFAPCFKSRIWQEASLASPELGFRIGFNSSHPHGIRRGAHAAPNRE